MPRHRVALLLALGGVLALLVMHGVSAHGLDFGTGHDAAAEVTNASGPAASTGGGDPATDVHQGHHHHGAQDGQAAPEQGDRGGARPSHGHGAAAVCAWIVIAVLFIPRRVSTRMLVRAGPPVRPLIRTWPPDPPVPKFALVLTPI